MTEHYRGRTYILTPGNWHGATNCAIVTPTQANCFDSAAQMSAFTSSTAALAPDSVSRRGVNCSGYTKIWSGASWTGTGLAFHDWGYPQNLNSYVTTPFTVHSWFSDGQRAYASNNCNGALFSGYNGTGASVGLPKAAHALNGPNFAAFSIELFQP